jgi:dolichol-phosphate mannosyltransferase
MKVLGFSPVYNQVHELPTLLRELADTAPPCDAFLLVDNGSNDGSEDLIRESGLPHIGTAENRGVGWAIMAATEWAAANGYDVLVGLASNGKMLPAEMGRVIGPILRDEADYVTGSRYLDGGASPNLPTFRRRAIPLVNGLVKLATGQAISDATCGYRAFRVDIFQRAQFDWQAEWLWTYAWEPYVYGKVLVSRGPGRVRWSEVPITMRYPAQGKRYTKIKPGLDWLKMIYPFFWARLERRGFR